MCFDCSTELPMLAVPATGTAHVLVVVRGTAVGGGVGVQVVIVVVVVVVVVDGGGGGAAAAAAAGAEKQAPTIFEHFAE